MNHPHPHQPTYKEPLLVFAALVVLTVLTVAVSGLFSSPTLALVAAFVIATGKATLVVRYFMHLKYEDSLFSWFLLVALGTFAVVFLLVFSDYGFRW
jgi:cytochrome c oxidase subunit 4